MATKEMKTYSLAEMKDKYIGKVGENDRDTYEDKLRVDVSRLYQLKLPDMRDDAILFAEGEEEV